MRIAFLVTRLDKPSARYRVFQYLPILERSGFVPEVHVIPGSGLKRMKLFAGMAEYDICFLQKKLLNDLEWHVLRKNSKKLVYDFDDAVIYRDSANTRQTSMLRSHKFSRTVGGSDLVIAGNEYLRGLAAEKNPGTIVIPTSVDITRYTEKPAGSASGTVTLGWIGSSATLLYMEKMKDIWDRLFDRYPQTVLKVVSDTFPECKRMPVIRKEWNYEEEIGDLHSFDIGLMPLTDDPWSRGKCGFKLLQYMAAGIPGVCSPVGVNREIVTDGLNGFLADGEKEWIGKTGRLIESAELRKEMGKKARETVVRNYSTDRAGKRLVEVLGALT